MPSIRHLLASMIGLAFAAPLTAQQVSFLPAGTVWMEVARAGDTRIAIDSVTIQRTADSTFFVATLIEFGDTLAAESGERFDREVDLQELSCGDGRMRGLTSALLAGDQQVALLRLTGNWQAVAEPQVALFRARCSFLLGSFAMRTKVVSDVTAVEERPQLRNTRQVTSALQRVYPSVRRAGAVRATILASFVISEEGRPEMQTLRAESDDLPDPLAIAQQIVPVMQFRAARVHGQPVRVRVQLPITFTPGAFPLLSEPGEPPLDDNRRASQRPPARLAATPRAPFPCRAGCPAH
jgi:hypothetical protein